MDPSAQRQIGALIERQMRNWEIGRSQRPTATDTPETPVLPFVTVSRMVGSGGSAYARALAECLDWPVFDREVLQYMAESDDVRERFYASMDEHDIGFINESIRAFTRGGASSSNDYFHRLNETILGIARKQNAVFVGRGADLILPREIGVRVACHAPSTVCADNYARQKGLDAALAAREVDRIEQDRRQFLRSRFNSDPDSRDRFDLQFNLSAITQAEAVQLTVELLRQRGLLS